MFLPYLLSAFPESSIQEKVDKKYVSDKEVPCMPASLPLKSRVDGG